MRMFTQHCCYSAYPGSIYAGCYSEHTSYWLKTVKSLDIVFKMSREQGEREIGRVKKQETERNVHTSKYVFNNVHTRLMLIIHMYL